MEESFDAYPQTEARAVQEGADTVHITREVLVRRMMGGGEYAERYSDLYLCNGKLPKVDLKAAGQKNGQLARIWVAEFVNSEKNPNYDWLAKSLPDAVTAAFRARFKYKPANARALAKKYKSINGVPDADQLAAIKADCDYMIFGGYVYDAAQEKVVIRSHVVDVTSGRSVGDIEHKSSTDARLFSVTEVIATDITKSLIDYNRNQSN